MGGSELLSTLHYPPRACSRLAAGGKRGGCCPRAAVTLSRVYSALTLPSVCGWKAHDAHHSSHSKTPVAWRFGREEQCPPSTTGQDTWSIRLAVDTLRASLTDSPIINPSSNLPPSRAEAEVSLDSIAAGTNDAGAGPARLSFGVRRKVRLLPTQLLRRKVCSTACHIPITSTGLTTPYARSSALGEGTFRRQPCSIDPVSYTRIVLYPPPNPIHPLCPHSPLEPSTTLPPSHHHRLTSVLLRWSFVEPRTHEHLDTHTPLHPTTPIDGPTQISGPNLLHTHPQPCGPRSSKSSPTPSSSSFWHTNSPRP